jgi:hypothetical protein
LNSDGAGTQREAPHLHRVLTFFDLLAYGLVYAAPIRP